MPNIQERHILNAHPLVGRQTPSIGLYKILKITRENNPRNGQIESIATSLWKENEKDEFYEQHKFKIKLDVLYNYRSVGQKDFPMESLINKTLVIKRVRMCLTFKKVTGEVFPSPAVYWSIKESFIATKSQSSSCQRLIEF